MNELTALESRFVRIQDELRQNAEVRVIWDTRGDIIRENPGTDTGESEQSIPLDDLPHAQYMRFFEIGSQWEALDTSQFIAGEFFLLPPSRSANEDPPDLVPLLHSEEEEALGQELRVIDACPMSGTGTFTAIRLQSNVTNPELWFCDDDLGLWKMDVDYRAYLDLLGLTKGAFSWQHLFTRAPLGEWEFQRTAERLVRMLDILPQIFPNEDYMPLQNRLEARL